MRMMLALALLGTSVPALAQQAPAPISIPPTAPLLRLLVSGSC